MPSNNKTYNPEIHHRHSIRLKGYDYSQEGLYFVTICVQDRECLLGEVKNGEMILNEYGKWVEYTWHDLPNHNPNIHLSAYCTMPNHVHGIIEIISVGAVGADSKSAQIYHDPGNDKGADSKSAQIYHDPGNDKGADSKSVPDSDSPDFNRADLESGNINRAGLEPAPTNSDSESDSIIVRAGSKPALDPDQIKKAGLEPAPTTLSEIIRQFKTFSARRINKQRATPGTTVWQRNYYEHIIRHQNAYENITNYIETNPARWGYDKFHNQ